ncbi:MAG: 30S ribosomal protein S9 [Parcubacteria group bacterium]|nr:MAG: 30S ribosomal protein S9 [Parcubacteria group bacterium]
MTPAIKKTDYTPAVGKRKRAIARVRILNDRVASIKIIVNGKDFKEYFPYFEWQENILKPLKLTGRDKISISVKVQGGGIKGQADSVRHGIARALLATDEELRSSLRKEGFLTRDSRIKERKKPGLKKARKAPQWSKR